LPTPYLLCLCVTALIFLISNNAKAGNEELHGTWRLVSLIDTAVATGETTYTRGKSPHGFINYSPDGRMLVLIVSDKRPKPPDLAKVTDQERIELFKTTTAYGGTYTYDGKIVTHHVDISWNETWTGTDNVREVKFEGKKLILSTRPAPRPLDGRLSLTVLTWERIQ
jgi:hypothetical protein